jgi:hypothetical protein
MGNLKNCPHCGGTDITEGVRINQTAEAGDIGLSYKTKFLLTGTEALYADVCNACGTIVRFFVKKTSREWYCK